MLLCRGDVSKGSPLGPPLSYVVEAFAIVPQGVANRARCGENSNSNPQWNDVMASSTTRREFLKHSALFTGFHEGQLEALIRSIDEDLAALSG